MKKTLQYFLFISVWLHSSTANAYLVSQDLLNSGDGLLTLDTSTGLQWLDLTQTTNISYNSILDGYGGWLGMGFRYATSNEVVNLYQAAGIPPTGPGAVTIMASDPVYESVQALVNFLGETGSNYQVTFENHFSAGATADLFPDTESVNCQIFTSVGWQIDSIGLLYFAHSGTNMCIGVDGQNSRIGSFLLRDTTAVPLPAAFWLFGSGLLGLVKIASRKGPKSSANEWSDD